MIKTYTSISEDSPAMLTLASTVFEDKALFVSVYSQGFC